MHCQQLWEEVHIIAFLIIIFHTTFGCYKKLTGWDLFQSVRYQEAWLSELPRFNEIGVLCWNHLQVEGCVAHNAIISFMTRPICLSRSGGNRNQPSAVIIIWDLLVWWNAASPCWNLKAYKHYHVVTDIKAADRSQVLDLAYHLKKIIRQCRICTMPGI